MGCNWNVGAKIYIGAPLSMLALLSACTNNLSISGQSSGNSITVSTTIGTSGTIGTSSTGAFPLSSVTIESASPPVFDLIGDGSGILGNYCQSTTGGVTGSAYDPTNCNCTYSYAVNGTNQTIDVPVIYHEANLVQCSYSSIPSGVTSVTVSIHLVSADTYSSQVVFNFTGLTTNLDTSQASSFSQVYRFQCRDIVIIPYIFDGADMYDPIQSDDPETTYPLDFYTTSFGNSISAYVNANQPLYNCPTILNPYLYLSPAGAAAYSQINNLNLNVYSAAPDTGNNKRIYPYQTGDFDRSTFYLANQSTGVFTVPINAYIAPTVNTVAGTGSNPPLGYGASPIVDGAGNVSCPSVPIPSGFSWVEVWLFRSSLAGRNYRTSPALTNVGSITCSPGDWVNNQGTLVPFFNGCPSAQDENTPAGTFLVSNNGSYDARLSTSIKDINATHFLSDRVTGNGECFRLDDLCGSGTTACGGTVLSPNTCGGFAGVSCDASTGADLWRAIVPVDSLSGAAGCESIASHLDPLDTCPGGTYTSSTAFPFRVSVYGSATRPFTTNVVQTSLDTAGSRFDFLFVVTPPNVTVDQMKGTAGLQYEPYRYPTLKDCSAADPDTDTTCQANANIKLTYSMKLHDVGSDESSNTPLIFPVCAIQPTTVN